MPYFDRNSYWLHGGPAELRGERLTRYGRVGSSDAGALFFVKNTPEQSLYAATYARPAIWRAVIDLKEDDVFDISNFEHRERVLAIDTEDFVGADMLLSADRAGCDIGLDWACIDEDVLIAAGFKAAICRERPQGIVSNEMILSLAVFDDKYVVTLDRMPDDVVNELKAKVYSPINDWRLLTPPLDTSILKAKISDQQRQRERAGGIFPSV